MEKQNLISVIVPVYKVEKYLRKCVDSILAQTYKNLEIILVDDGSPDDCPAICDEYGRNNNRIKVIHKPNGGLSDARNAGIEIATGDWIGFVDSDDYIHPQMYEILLVNAVESGADVSECNFLKFNNESKITVEHIENYEKVITDLQTVCQKQSYLFAKNQVAMVWKRLFKKHIFETLRFPYKMIHEDEFVFPDWVLIAKSIVSTNNRLYFYLQRKNSIMGTAKNKSLDILEVARHCLQILPTEEMKARAWSLWSSVIFSMLHTANKQKDSEYIQKINDWLKSNQKNINEAKRCFSFKEKVKLFTYKNKVLWKVNRFKNRLKRGKDLEKL